MVESEIQSGRGLSDALNEAQLRGQESYQNHLYDLLKSERQAEIEKQIRDEQRGGIGGFLGELAGAAIPGVGGLARRLLGGGSSLGGASALYGHQR